MTATLETRLLETDLDLILQTVETLRDELEELIDEKAEKKLLNWTEIERVVINAQEWFEELEKLARDIETFRRRYREPAI